MRTHHGPHPWVTISYAQSVDGCLAARRGQPTAISGPESSALVHRLRALHACILVGIGTVLSDNPRLTTRLAAGPSPRPVILDSNLQTPLNAALFEHPLPPLIACRMEPEFIPAELLRTAGAEILPLPVGPDGRLSLPSLLDALAAQGIRSLMVEGGAAVLTAFLTAGLADALVVTVAPRLLGGQQAILAPPARQLSQPQLTPCGADLIYWGAFA